MVVFFLSFLIIRLMIEWVSGCIHISWLYRYFGVEQWNSTFRSTKPLFFLFPYKCNFHGFLFCPDIFIRFLWCMCVFVISTYMTYSPTFVFLRLPLSPFHKLLQPPAFSSCSHLFEFTIIISTILLFIFIYFDKFCAPQTTLMWKWHKTK